MSLSNLTGDELFAMYLNHDHRERENIGFFAVRPLLAQDLRRSPSHGMIMTIRGTPDGIQVFSNGGKTKIRDPCATGGIHKDIWLDTCQRAGKRDLEQSHTPLRLP